jgi:DNA-binding transcriptional regulator PaaX
MGKIEEKSKNKTKRKNLQNLVLTAVASAGILSVSLMAPNVMRSMTKLGLIPNRRQKEYIASSASKMVQKGLLRYNGKFYELTLLGQERLRRWEFVNFKLNQPKKWDKKWRVIIFDIPEKKKKIRNRITSLFHQAGFYRLQDSVWVYPHDCEDVITLLKTDLGVGKYLLYLIVDEIENDKYLRKAFNLI